MNRLITNSVRHLSEPSPGHFSRRETCRTNHGYDSIPRNQLAVHDNAKLGRRGPISEIAPESFDYFFKPLNVTRMNQYLPMNLKAAVIQIQPASQTTI
jgi:hypothetical protein